MTAYTPPEGSIVHEIDLRLDNYDFPPLVDLTQYDTTIPILKANLWENCKPYTVPSGGAASIRMRKPDGKGVYNPVLGISEDNHSVFIAVTSQMTAAAGDAVAIVEITNGGGIIGTGKMTLHIARNPVQDNQYESSDEYKTLDDLIKEAKASADAAKNSQTEAKKSQDEAKKSETAAAKSAETASSQAQAAQGSADAAAASQKKAADSEANAAASAKSAKDAQTAAETAQSNAEAAQSAAEDWSNKSQSWAIGTGDTSRPDQATDNSKYYASQAAKSATQAGTEADRAETAKTGAETAQGEAEKARDAAKGSETAAAGSATEAGKQAQAAQGSASDAETAKAGAEQAKTGAEDAKAGAEAAAAEAAQSANKAKTSEGAAADSAAEAKAAAEAAVSGGITRVKTTAGQHTPVDVTKGEALFNVPTSTSHLKNDSGFLTAETDPKFAASPAAGITSENIESWNAKTSNAGTITEVKTAAGKHTAIDVKSGVASFSVPTSTNHLTNDSGFVTSSHNHDAAYVKKTGDTMTGDLTLSGTTRYIKYTSSLRTGTNAISLYEGDANGDSIAIGCGGRTIIGGGESAGVLRNVLGTTAADNSREELHLANDEAVQVHTGCQTIANRHTYTFQTDGRLSGVANPTQATDAANKQYVDSGLGGKMPLVGTLLSNEEDLNNYYGNGKIGFYCGGGGNTVKNKPSGVNVFGLIVMRGADGEYDQLLTDGGQKTLWMRHGKDASSWGEWAKFYNTANKPTASDVGAAASSHTSVKATGTALGHVTLSDTISDSSADKGVAATPKAVKDAISNLQIPSQSTDDLYYKPGDIIRLSAVVVPCIIISNSTDKINIRGSIPLDKPLKPGSIVSAKFSTSMFGPGAESMRDFIITYCGSNSGKDDMPAVVRGSCTVYYSATIGFELSIMPSIEDTYNDKICVIEFGMDCIITISGQ